jgi:SAM-dependent methyltransferase
MTADADYQPDFSSRDYWEARYRAGKTSGSGSRGRLAKYKASEINRIVADHQITSVLDFGCGDGFQIGLLDVPHYTGLDVSPAALELCRAQFADRAGWRFLPVADRSTWAGRYDMAMSLDVIFHLVETEVFEAYMHDLFAHTDRLVLIYSSDVDHDAPGRHVLHRNVSRWTSQNLPHWHQTRSIPNPFGRAIDQPHDRRTSVARFMLYEPAVRA